MNIVTIIGTRPQYIKIKPLFDYFKNNGINNYLVDTNQHYSDNVSQNLIAELNLSIDRELHIDTSTEALFISDSFSKISEIMDYQP